MKSLYYEKKKISYFIIIKLKKLTFLRKKIIIILKSLKRVFIIINYKLFYKKKYLRDKFKYLTKFSVKKK